MKRNLLTAILLASFLTFPSCTQTSSQAEKDYIKNLEEKNKVLEKELLEAKNKSNPDRTTSKFKQKTQKLKDYFTIGSTEDEVLEVMGDPTTYVDMGSAGKRFMYGISSVVFENGKVESYNNLDGNLKVKVKE
ncbi:MAG: hypothetical protein JST02_12415 [Bacteroidetes bacterium]|nr:hypothetical protein [Bacteroidota bacterium]